MEKTWFFCFSEKESSLLFNILRYSWSKFFFKKKKWPAHSCPPYTVPYTEVLNPSVKMALAIPINPPQDVIKLSNPQSLQHDPGCSVAHRELGLTAAALNCERALYCPGNDHNSKAADCRVCPVSMPLKTCKVVSQITPSVRPSAVIGCLVSHTGTWWPNSLEALG